MYLYARLFGVITYCVSLIIICYLLSKRNSNTKTILIIYCLLLSIMAFLFKPAYGNDLHRIFEVMEIYAKEDFFVFIDRLKSFNGPLSLIYFRIIGQFEIKGLLPFFTTIICYSNIFYVFYSYSRDNNISKKAQAISLLIIMCNSSFFECISGIRTMLAFSILLRCYYNENYKEKYLWKNIILYIVACMIHPIAIIITIVRFADYFRIKLLIKSERNFLQIVILLFMVGSFIFIGYRYINNTFIMAEKYLIEGKYTYIWENIITSLLFVLIFIFQNNITKNKSDEKLVRNKKYSRIYEIIILGFCREHNIFFRINNYNLFLNIPIILTSTEKILNSKNENYKFLILYTMMILILTCTRGNLCSLKFWEVI